MATSRIEALQARLSLARPLEAFTQSFLRRAHPETCERFQVFLECRGPRLQLASRSFSPPSEAVWANDNNEDVPWLLNRTIPIKYIGKEFKRGVFGPLNADIDSLYLLSQILKVEQLSAQAL